MEKVKRLALSCLKCGKTHLKLPCQLKRGRGKFCSKQCKQEHSRTQVAVVCDGCEVQFKKFPCEIKDSENFCTKICYDKHRRMHAKETTYLKVGTVHEHILVAEKVLKRKLLPDEVVHHIDEVKHNNKPENLAVLPSQQLHARFHRKPSTVDLTPYLLKNYL